MARKFEGSPADEKVDRKIAKSKGTSLKAFEGSAADRKIDKAGQAKLDAKAKAKRSKKAR